MDSRDVVPVDKLSHTEATLLSNCARALPYRQSGSIQGLGLCNPLRPSASVDNTNLDLDNSRYHA